MNATATESRKANIEDDPLAVFIFVFRCHFALRNILHSAIREEKEATSGSCNGACCLLPLRQEDVGFYPEPQGPPI
jgi:hypothetical protein